MALTDGLISYWKMDESSAGAGAVTRNDSHGTNHLTDNNTTASGTGILNNGADLEASNSEYFNRAAQTWGVANEWSWSLWVKPESFAGNPRVLFLSSGTSGSSFYNNVTFGFSTGGVIFLNTYNSTGGAIKETTYGTFSTATWYHICFTWDGTNLKLYVNGSEVTLTYVTNNSGTMTDTSRAWFIGATNAGTAPYDGLLDEVGVWSRAVTSGEVTTLYGAGTPPAYPFATLVSSGIMSFF